MKTAFVFILLGMVEASRNQLGIRAMSQVSMVLPEAPVPLHKVPPQKQLGLVESSIQENLDADRFKRMRNNQKTTLTIVQDFPKKQSENNHDNQQLVQADHFKLDDKNKTTLTIVQDFPKKKSDHLGGVEMVQQEKFKMDNNKNKTTTLTIV